jgi:hypothetical protein
MSSKFKKANTTLEQNITLDLTQFTEFKFVQVASGCTSNASDLFILEILVKAT